MSRTAWIILGVAAVVGVGIVIYMVTRPARAPADSLLGSGNGENDTAGIIGTIGTGLTTVAQGLGQALSRPSQESEDEE